MENQDYHKPEEFILSESFRNYVLKKDKGDIAYWNNWIHTHPDQEEEFYKAATVLGVLLKARKRPVLISKDEALKELLGKIESNNRLPGQNTSRLFANKWIRAAAVVFVVLSLAFIFKYIFTQRSVNDGAFCEIVVPIGEKSQIILPDGTHIWINSGSRFVYPATYGVNNRSVFLEGEAYFDVTKYKKMPFIVKTKDVKVRVLGTAFNVKSYNSDKTVETTVVRGLVKVSGISDCKTSILVNPDEKAVFMKDPGQRYAGLPGPPNKAVYGKPGIQPLIVVKANAEAVTCWKDQLLVFTDETFEDMVVKMERWYNIRITITDPTLKTERFNGKFVHNETVYQVLEAVKLTTPIDYKVRDNEIIITRK
jgi:transmembrane sensor